MKIMMITVLATMLAVTSGLADQQADYIARIRANPTADFSAGSSDDLIALGEADAMVYFQDNKTISLSHEQAKDLGASHAFKHHLIGMSVDMYSMGFTDALRILCNN
jgi:hypothetical protein